MGTVTTKGSTYPRTINNLTFVDGDTFLIGTKEKSYDQIQPAYAWGDTEWKLNARFSDVLRGWLKWSYRKTTDNFLGDWYASIGDYTVAGDLYDYKIRENWVEGMLNYSLYRPLLTAYLGAGANLESKEDLYANESAGYAKTGLNWTNSRKTLVLNGGVNVVQRQLYDPSDVKQYQDLETSLSQGVSYTPRSGRWYLKVVNNVSLTQNAKSEASDSGQYTYFTDEETTGKFKIIFGRRFGPKWMLKIDGQYDYQTNSTNKLEIFLDRDLHDAVGIVRLRVDDENSNSSSNRDSASPLSYDVRASIKFKLPAKNVDSAVSDIKTLGRQARQAAVSP